MKSGNSQPSSHIKNKRNKKKKEASSQFEITNKQKIKREIVA